MEFSEHRDLDKVEKALSDLSDLVEKLCGNGSVDAVERLLRLGAVNDINVAFKAAIEGCNLDVADMLLKRGANVNENDCSLLRDVAKKTDNAVILEYLVEHGANKERAALLLASDGEKKALENLLNSGLVDVNAQTKEGGFAPLMGAVVGAIDTQNTDTLKYLIERGANPDLLDNEGRKAVDFMKGIEHRAEHIVKDIEDIIKRAPQIRADYLKTHPEDKRELSDFLSASGHRIEKNRNVDSAVITALNKKIR